MISRECLSAELASHTVRRRCSLLQTEVVWIRQHFLLEWWAISLLLLSQRLGSIQLALTKYVCGGMWEVYSDFGKPAATCMYPLVRQGVWWRSLAIVSVWLYKTFFSQLNIDITVPAEGSTNVQFQRDAFCI